MLPHFITTAFRSLYKINLSQKFLLPSPAHTNLQLEQVKLKMLEAQKARSGIGKQKEYTDNFQMTKILN